MFNISKNLPIYSYRNTINLPSKSLFLTLNHPSEFNLPISNTLKKFSTPLISFLHVNHISTTTKNNKLKQINNLDKDNNLLSLHFEYNIDEKGKEIIIDNLSQEDVELIVEATTFENALNTLKRYARDNLFLKNKNSLIEALIKDKHKISQNNVFLLTWALCKTNVFCI